MQRYCIKCGAEIPEGVYICPNCGQEIPEDATQVDYGRLEKIYSRYSSTNHIRFIGFSIGLTMILLISLNLSNDLLSRVNGLTVCAIAVASVLVPTALFYVGKHMAIKKSGYTDHQIICYKSSRRGKGPARRIDKSGQQPVRRNNKLFFGLVTVMFIAMGVVLINNNGVDGITDAFSELVGIEPSTTPATSTPTDSESGETESTGETTSTGSSETSGRTLDGVWVETYSPGETFEDGVFLSYDEESVSSSEGGVEEDGWAVRNARMILFTPEGEAYLYEISADQIEAGTLSSLDIKYIIYDMSEIRRFNLVFSQDIIDRLSEQTDMSTWDLGYTNYYEYEISGDTINISLVIIEYGLTSDGAPKMGDGIIHARVENVLTWTLDGENIWTDDGCMYEPLETVASR